MATKQSNENNDNKAWEYSDGKDNGENKNGEESIENKHNNEKTMQQKKSKKKLITEIMVEGNTDNKMTKEEEH